MKSRASRTAIFLCFYGGLLFSQADAGFIAHLSGHQLQREHRAYLNTFPSRADSLFFHEAAYYLQYFNDTAFVRNYSLGKGLFDGNASLVRQASLKLLLSNNEAAKKDWFAGHPGDIAQVYYAANDPNAYQAAFFPENLQPRFVSYKKAYNKKPVLAMALSTVLPGAGKFYAGKKKSGLLAFILNAGYALQTIESTQKLGIKHPLSIINAGAFTVFYLANIYGGYRAVIDLRRENKKQFLSDAANFYN